jgi:hypothetical protein
VAVSARFPDTSPPSNVQLRSPDAGQTYHGVIALRASAQDNVAVDHVDFTADARNVATASGPSFTAQLDTSRLRDGARKLQATAVDADGNRTSSEQVAVTIDNTPPVATLVSGPDADPGIASSNVEFRFLVDRDATWQCNLDDGAFGPCTSAVTQSYSGLADGDHVFRVRGFDPVGNVGGLARSFRVDTRPPDTTISDGPSAGSKTSERKARFTFDAEPGAAYECGLDGGAFAPCPGGDPHGASYAGLPTGSHTFRVRAIDRVGNVEPDPATRSWTIVSDLDGDGFDIGPDCDDTHPRIHPGARDIPGNKVDEDCDGADAEFPDIGADVRPVWRVDGGSTTLVQLQALRVPTGARIVVRCAGPRHACPVRVARASAARARKSMSIATKLTRHPLPAGSTISVTITKAGTRGLAVRFRIRADKAPRRTDRCLPATARDHC